MQEMRGSATMTAPDFAQMTDMELNAEAARLMGLRRWIPSPKSSDNVYVYRDGVRQPQKFDPANDLNHAAEFGAAFLAKNEGWAFTSQSDKVAQDDGSILVMWEGILWTVSPNDDDV